ncbi:hypothetical protein GHK92_16695 [Nocardioides sp. dk4132]|uniref:hypothetical protein n=1 Tax=unclassified Nocardioides TaxID=2615069 RepID=UPI001294CF62|nr:MULTISPECIES: hypothetical protein [unclassified Nocardioides]MQW77513.1 hypothetical protein [Nocardioides sp. dk4132]QGA09311.1 hypothetical protein GFH29_19375 [Nocardioides sp. dk884]
MSKMDALRAMREAKYEAAQKAAGSGTTARRPAATPTKATKAAPAKDTKRGAKAAEAPAADAATELCGHRNMSGRTCTREQGHAAKSHRYS